MFERRVKIFLLALVLATLALVGRMFQVQVIQHGDWSGKAEEIMSTSELLETKRGRLLDRNQQVIAEDVPCTDACVDYRAILPDPDEKWVRTIAAGRIKDRLEDEYRHTERGKLTALVDEEVKTVKADINEMWRVLARLGDMTPDQIEELRQSIVRKVDMRRRLVWYTRYQKAVEKQSPTTSTWYSRWLTDDSQAAPELDEYLVEVGEQVEPHVILPAIESDTINFLTKNAEHFPGLVLRAGLHRNYPFHDVAAHVIGTIGHVTQADLDKQKGLEKQNAPGQVDELRRYERNDLIGKNGLELICEPLLRGTRGKSVQHGDKPKEIDEPVFGKDVVTTLDMGLQGDVQRAFTQIKLQNIDRDPALSWIEPPQSMPGAAVVLDVKTNEVLVMASYPSFDLNTLDEQYSILADDDINQPLLNRATRMAMEPGSTVKPMVGMGAITQGTFPLDGTVECTGYLQLNGKVYRTEGRCWVASMYAGTYGVEGVKHHPFPVPHPTGFLTFPDALERSCNVFFETLADKLGMDGLGYWFGQFGLGSPTGVGLSEVSGSIPGDRPVEPSIRRAATWFSGIGQSQVLATPIQMANVAATIARGGIWMRPRLVPDPSTTDRVDLHLNPAAVALAKEGMMRVVASKAGTGQLNRTDDLKVAGKTGSAQAAPLKAIRRDAEGHKITHPQSHLEVNDDGELAFSMREVPEYEPLPIGTHKNPNPPDRAPWYRGTGADETHISHAWYIGFAPADDPKIAFAVMVEYGGGGGATAAQVVNKLLNACIQRGYLHSHELDTSAKNAE